MVSPLSDDEQEQPGPERRGLMRELLDRIGRYEYGVLASLLAIVLAVMGFIWIADKVVDGATLRFDDWAIRALRRPENPAIPIGPRWLAEVGRDMTTLGGVAFISLLTLTIAGYLWLRRLYGTLTLLLTSVVGGLIVSSVLKAVFARPRPDLVPHLSIVSTSSFPSGHAMMSAVVFLTIGTLLGRVVPEFRLKAYFLIIAIVLTLLVGVSRVYMGVHYPTDVLAGWAAGLAWALGCGLIGRAFHGRMRFDRKTGVQNDGVTSMSSKP